MFVDPTKKYPGPGSYNFTIATDNKNGFTLHSKFKSPGAISIAKNGERFDRKDLKRSIEVPGPGNYTANHAAAKTHYGNTIFGR